VNLELCFFRNKEDNYQISHGVIFYQSCNQRTVNEVSKLKEGKNE